jgi:hypothetical protein
MANKEKKIDPNKVADKVAKKAQAAAAERPQTLARGNVKTMEYKRYNKKVDKYKKPVLDEKGNQVWEENISHYAPVVERVKAITSEEFKFTENLYEITKHEVFDIGRLSFLRVYVLMGVKPSTPDAVDNRPQYIGTAQINIGGSGVDATSAYENAETSAVGRALAFAGVGLTDDMASLDEMQAAEKREFYANAAAEKNDKPPLTTESAGSGLGKANDMQKQMAFKIIKSKGVIGSDNIKAVFLQITGRETMLDMTFTEAQKAIDDLKAMTAEQVAEISKPLSAEEKAALGL